MAKKKNNTKYGSRNNKGYSKGRSKYQRKDTGADQSNQMDNLGGNDVSWYTRNPAMVDAAAKIPFAMQPGRSREWPSVVGESTGVTYRNKFDYPGVAVMNFIPTIGRSTDLQSPVNIAAREIYGRIRSKYSGALEADAPDLMMYILAVDNAYMLYEHFKRAYYLINNYTPYNNFFPGTVVDTLGFNHRELMESKTMLYQYLVEAGAKLSKFMVPDIMPLFARHSFMCANLYADSPNPRAQIYAFKPRGYYQVQTTGETGTRLVYSELPEDMNVYTIKAILTEVIDALMEWDTAYTILGYFMRAYEGAKWLLPSPVVADAVLNPVYNWEVLTQIHNATITNVDVLSLAVTQDPNTNAILSEVRVGNDVKALVGAIVNIRSDNQPTPADVIEATRLTTVFNTVADYLEYGTEIITSLHIFTGRNAHEPVGVFDTPFFDHEESIDVSSLMSYAALSAFDMHPHVIGAAGSNTNKFAALFSDIDNMTIVDGATLGNLHRMCIYSQFNCFGDN